MNTPGEAVSLDRNPNNDAPVNLRWVSASENVKNTSPEFRVARSQLMKAAWNDIRKLRASHDALLAACEYARGVLLECGAERDLTQGNALQVIDALTAAIRKATP